MQTGYNPTPEQKVPRPFGDLVLSIRGYSCGRNHHNFFLKKACTISRPSPFKLLSLDPKIHPHNSQSMQKINSSSSVLSTLSPHLIWKDLDMPSRQRSTHPDWDSTGFLTVANHSGLTHIIFFRALPVLQTKNVSEAASPFSP